MTDAFDHTCQIFAPGDSVLMFSKMFGRSIYGRVTDAFPTPGGWFYTVDFGPGGSYQLQGDQITRDTR